ncbi:MAG: 2'-5' RNA ligase family protein [Candidatus Hodarchaeota archaeon]
MSKVNTSAVVIIPPKEKWNHIQEIRSKYDRNVERWMPHITLLYPFRAKSSYFEVEDKFIEICSQITPFKLSLKSFKYFNHGHQNYTIWLEPEPSESIIALQAKILQIVPDCDDVNKYKKGFTPHLSVGQIKGKEKLLKLIHELQSSWVQLEFTVNDIFFIAREKSKIAKFEIEKQFPLSN